MCAGPAPSELTVLSSVNRPVARSMEYALTVPAPVSAAATSLAEYRCVRVRSNASHEGLAAVLTTSRWVSTPVAGSISSRWMPSPRPDPAGAL